MKLAEVILCRGVAVISREAEPLQRLLAVFPDTRALVVREAELVGSLDMPLVGSLFIPAERLLEVNAGAVALGEHVADVVLTLGAAILRLLHFAVEARAVGFHQPKPRNGLAVALVGGPCVPLDGLVAIGLDPAAILVHRADVVLRLAVPVAGLLQCFPEQ